jgi:hypothetical protein
MKLKEQHESRVFTKISCSGFFSALGISSRDSGRNEPVQALSSSGDEGKSDAENLNHAF